MPARQPDRLTTETLQGEDSYIELRRPTHQEIRDVGRMRRKIREDYLKALEEYSKSTNGAAPPEEPDDTAMNLEELAGYVLDWNWVDDDGTPLPKPTKDDWSVMYRLTDEEAGFIARRIRLPSEERLKN